MQPQSSGSTFDKWGHDKQMENRIQLANLKEKFILCTVCRSKRGWCPRERRMLGTLVSLQQVVTGHGRANPNLCHTFSQPHTNTAGKGVSDLMVQWAAGLSDRIWQTTPYESALWQTLFMVTQCDMTKRTQSQVWLHQQWVCETNTAYRLFVS